MGVRPTREAAGKHGGRGTAWVGLEGPCGQERAFQAEGTTMPEPSDSGHCVSDGGAAGPDGGGTTGGVALPGVVAGPCPLGLPWPEALALGSRLWEENEIGTFPEA